MSRALAPRFLTALLLVVALGTVFSDLGTPKAAACPSCFTESGTAYVYCRDHYDPNDPDTWHYFGCNFTYVCPASSATQVYRSECQL
jgi:hypothetical protein